MTVILGYDPATLEERVDLQAAGERLAELGELRSLTAMNEKTELLRLVGRVDEAWEMANAAVRQVRFTGNREELLGARIRRCRVAAARGKREDARTELGGCADEARAHKWPRLEAFALGCRGRVSFALGDYPEALADFTASASELEKAAATPEEVEVALIAVAVAGSFIDERVREAG